MCSNASMPSVEGMNEQDERARSCSASGCTTKLSRYNTSNELCFAHADERSRARFERWPDATPSVIYRHHEPSSVRDQGIVVIPRDEDSGDTRRSIDRRPGAEARDSPVSRKARP